MRNQSGADEVKETILALKEDQYKSVLGYACSKKGRSGDLAKAVCKDIANLGMGKKKIILKSDQENAICDLCS